MKRFVFLSILSMGAYLAATAQPPCSRVVTISNDITANRTLYADTLYRIQGCISVRNNATLTIEPATAITLDDDDYLIIRKDGYIIAQGTSGNTIKFMGVGSPGSRSVKHGGVIIEGDGIVNKSPIALPNSLSHVTGTDNTDSSGVLQYVEFHYLGGSSSLGDVHNGLNFIGAGNRTLADYIQVSNSDGNGIGVLGGAVNIKNAFMLDCSKAGLHLVYGYVGNLQNILVIQKNTAMHDAAGTFGVLVENNPGTPTATPITNFTGSNFTVLGIQYCDPGMVSSDFLDGIRFDNNAAGSLYNSFVSGSNNYGLFINDVGSAQHTASDLLNVSNCSFTGNSSGDYGQNPSITWSGNGCSSSMMAWMTGSTSLGCEEVDNQFSPFDPAYDASFCDDYCGGTFTRNFVLDDANSALDPPDYTGLPAFFDAPDFRGAIQDVDITSGWSTVCPQNLVTCTSPSPKLRNTTSGTLKMVPNPAHTQTQIEFEVQQKGLVRVLVTDKVSGRVFFEKEWQAKEPGTQKVIVPLNHLMPDIYTVQVITGNSKMFGKLVVQ